MLLTKCIDDNIALGKSLENEVQALRSRFDKLEKSVKDLQSTCDMHRRSLETFCMCIVHLEGHQGMLREEFELMS
jgi:hypothetical protein